MEHRDQARGQRILDVGFGHGGGIGDRLIGVGPSCVGCDELEASGRATNFPVDSGAVHRGRMTVRSAEICPTAQI